MIKADGTIMEVNAAWHALLGYASAELQNKDIASILHSDDRAKTLRALKIATRKAVRVSILRLLADLLCE